MRIRETFVQMIKKCPFLGRLAPCRVHSALTESQAEFEPLLTSLSGCPVQNILERGLASFTFSLVKGATIMVYHMLHF